MNAYIHPDNQKLLWNTINNVPMVANLPPEFKNNWFKQIVKMFYEQSPHIKDKSVLLQINKSTIQYMMANAKSLMQQQQQQQQQTPNIGITSEFTRYESDNKKNAEWYSQAFADRQKEYEIMHAKPIAPEVNFAIKLDDTPLNNMDELIEKYKQDREKDMVIDPPLLPTQQQQNTLPPPPLPQQKTTFSQQQQSSIQQNGLSLDKLKKKPPRLEVIREEDVDDEVLPSVVDIVNTANNQIPELISQIEELRNQLKQLREEFDEFKKQ